MDLQRIGTRPHGARWGPERDIFHVRRAKADLPSLEAPINTWQILNRRNIRRTNRANRSVSCVGQPRSNRSKEKDEKAVFAYFDCPNRGRQFSHGR